MICAGSSLCDARALVCVMCSIWTHLLDAKAARRFARISQHVIHTAYIYICICHYIYMFIYILYIYTRIVIHLSLSFPHSLSADI